MLLARERIDIFQFLHRYSGRILKDLVRMLRVFRFLLALWATTNVVDVPMSPASCGDLGGHVFVSWSVWRVLIGPFVLRLFIRDSISARLKSHVCQSHGSPLVRMTCGSSSHCLSVLGYIFICGSPLMMSRGMTYPSTVRMH